MVNRWGSNENSDNFIFLGSKITVDGDCSHEIKILMFTSWKKSYDQPRQHIKKQKHYFSSKGSSSQSYGFSSKSYGFSNSHVGCDSWTIKKAECWRIYASELWCWRRHLRGPWTARRSNQSILKEISPGCSLEGLMLTPKFQYFGHLMQRADSFEKTLMLGRIEGRRRRERQRMRWLDGIIDSMDMSWASPRRWWWTDKTGVLQSMGLQQIRHYWVTELNSLFILSGVISPLISKSILGTYRPGEFIFHVLSFCLFILFMGFSREEYCNVCHCLL